MTIGEKITYFRNKKNYSVNRLANLAGISQSYLRDIELGNKKPTVEILSYICDALEISLSNFFKDEVSNDITTDPLLTKIYQLTPVQRSALSSFIDTMLEK